RGSGRIVVCDPTRHTHGERFMTSRCRPLTPPARCALLLLLLATPARSQPNPQEAALALDQRIIAEAKKSSEVMANLAHLSDVIGPRLTGSAALKRANDWTTEKMKSYGLDNVRLEPWSMPEGWKRGRAAGTLLEPDNGRTLALA